MPRGKARRERLRQEGVRARVGDRHEARLPPAAAQGGAAGTCSSARHPEMTTPSAWSPRAV